jgi:hypothetical protein
MKTTLDSQIRVSTEKDAKHIPDLTFIPIRPSKQTRSRRDRGDLIRISLYPDSTRMSITQEVVDDFESVRTSGDVYGGDVHDGFELTLVVVP